MKKILFIIPALIAAAAFSGCDSDKTELSFTNDSASETKINEILWPDPLAAETKWEQEGGWDQGATTTAKEVTATTGEVTCSMPDGNGDWAQVNIKINGDAAIISLEKGASNNFVIFSTGESASASVAGPKKNAK